MSETTDSNDAYFDANIWVAYMLNELDQHHLFANKLVDEMQKGKYQVYVSDLVLLETITSLRRKLPVKIEKTHMTKSSLKEHVKTKTYDFLNIMVKLEMDEKIINKNPNMPITQLHRNANRYLINYFGDLQRQGKHYLYKGLNHWDFQHALIAKSVGASVFYTTDSGFEQLKKIEQFSSLNFVINTSQ